jgi:hypothetical protein
MKFLSSKVTIALFFSIFLTSCTSGTVETAGPTSLSSTTYSGTLTSVTLSTSDPSVNPTGQAIITATVTFNFTVTDGIAGSVNFSGTFTSTSLTGNYSRPDDITSTTTSTQTTSSTTTSVSGATTSTTSNQSSTPTNVFSGCPAHSGTINANA